MWLIPRKGHHNGITEEVTTAFFKFEFLSLPKLWIQATKGELCGLGMGLPAIASSRALSQLRENNNAYPMMYNPRYVFY